VPTEYLAPLLTFLGTVLVAIIVGAFAVFNRRRGALEAKIPTVAEIWRQQVDQETRFNLKIKEVSDKADIAKKEAEDSKKDRDTYKTAFVGLRTVFLAFVERVQSGGSLELTTAEHQALELPVTRVEEDDLAGS
jgi:hypothetical protein